MDINYELYKVFYHVAKTLSFSDASRELFISQSAVSQSIKVLEKRLDQTLFVRSTKRVRLTREGEMLFKHIEPAINLINLGERQLLESHSLKVPMPVFLLENVGVPSYLHLSNCMLDHVSAELVGYYKKDASNEH